MQSLLPAGHALTPQTPGEYYLAVGAYNLDPLGADEPIFGPGTGVVGPTGLGGREPVSGWGGRLGGSGPCDGTVRRADFKSVRAHRDDDD